MAPDIRVTCAENTGNPQYWPRHQARHQVLHLSSSESSTAGPRAGGLLRFQL